MIKIASLFDGIGGTPLCAQMAGASCLWASEIEKFPIEVTKYHFPDMAHYGDITQIKGADVPAVDIIVGGSPCQDLSVAGKRKGLIHEDLGNKGHTRSGLFMEQVRIVKEMREHARATNKPVRPRYVVWENVPGAFSSKGAGNKLEKGEAFKIVLEEFCKIADESVSIPRPNRGKWLNAGSIVGSGFSLAWRTMDAKYWGVAQRRRRIYLVVDLGGQSASEILFEREGMSWNIAESNGERERTSGNAARGFGETGRVSGFSYKVSAKAGTTGFQKEQSPTILSERHDAAICYGIGGFNSGGMLSDNPKAGIYEAGTSRTLDLNGGNPACNQGGIAIVQSEPVVFAGESVTSPQNVQNPSPGDPCPTLNTDSRKYVVYENHGQGSRITGPLDVSPTVSRKHGTGGNNVPLVARMQSFDGEYSIDGTASALKARDYKDATDLVVTSVDCRNMRETETFGTLQAKEIGGQSLNYSGALRIKNRVRRLTPLECERLQGYPDGWTDIPGASDSARYRALGNSFAIPNAYFVISRCIEKLKEAT